MQKKYITGYTRGQMGLKVLCPDDVGKIVSDLIKMGCDIQSADKNHIRARFLRGTLPDGESGSAALARLLDDGWVFEPAQPEHPECSCDCDRDCASTVTPASDPEPHVPAL